MQDKVAKSYNVSLQGVEMNEVDRDEEVLEELFFNLVFYADKKSSSMAEVCATKWKIMNSLSVSLQMQIAFTNIASVPTTWRI